MGIEYKIDMNFKILSDFKDISDLLKTALQICAHAGEVRETQHAILVFFLISLIFTRAHNPSKRSNSDKLPFDFPEIWCFVLDPQSIFCGQFLNERSK